MLNRILSGDEAATPDRTNTLQGVSCVVAIILVSFFYNRWLIGQELYFYFDDWNWLEHALSWPWQTYLKIFPSMIYNDRPVGGALIKLMYRLFGLDHQAYAALFLGLHTLNCMLVYAIGSRFMPRAGALLSALLAATWLSSQTSLTWSAAIFDVLGATLCLLTLLVRQISAQRGGLLLLDLCGAILLALSIRTKEFALANIALLFVLSVFLEHQKPRLALKQLTPYLVVFLVYLVCYGYLQTHKPLDSANPYSLDFNPLSILGNLWFYASTLLYLNLFSIWWALALAVLTLLSVFTLSRKQWLIVGFSVLGFAAMLGPTLLIPKHRDELYLYAPHFFLAIGIGAIYSKRHFGKALSVLFCVLIFAIPLAAGRYLDIVTYYSTLGSTNQKQLQSAQAALGQVERGTTVFVSGAKPIFNPISYGPGASLRVVYQDMSIKAVEGETPDALQARFCATKQPKRFIDFKDESVTDITAQLTAKCGG